MEVIVRPTAADAVALAARIIEARLRARPDLVLGLATGRTMERVYDHLVQSGVSFRQVRTFNLDEYIGLAPEDPNSYRSYMRRHLFDRTDVDLANTHLPQVDGDPAEASARFEAAIREAGGIDLQLLGIGENGHIGFNEPLSSLMSRTRDKSLTPETRRQNAGMFGGDPERVPSRAMTMGVGTILEAREVLLLATGPHKADMTAKALEGPITAMISATALQLHPRCKVVLDEGAASGLAGRAYYDFVWNTEPEWAPYR